MHNQVPAQFLSKRFSPHSIGVRSGSVYPMRHLDNRDDRQRSLLIAKSRADTFEHLPDGLAAPLARYQNA